MLLIAGVDDVATVGYQVGYDSSSQFNREYRRQFGLPPGRDAARLRGDVPATAYMPIENPH
jgi:AraC-like DNA-binding protein